MATTENGRVRLGEPLSLEAVAERLDWDSETLAAHLVQRRQWANEAIDRLGPTSVPEA